MDNFNILNKENFYHPLIISIPHSGTYIPSDIQRNIVEGIVLANTDWFLPELYDFFEHMGVTVIKNNISRYVIDVNRNSNIIKTNDYRRNLVFSNTSSGRKIYKRHITRKDVERRIKLYYNPYHNVIKELIREKFKIFKKVYILDLHSYDITPSGITDKVLLGNQNGSTCSEKYFDIVCNAFLKENIDIERNKEFLGGYITKHYGTEYGDRVETIQIEIPYSKYIEDRVFGEEVVKVYNEEVFEKMKHRLENIFNDIIKEI